MNKIRNWKIKNLKYIVWNKLELKWPKNTEFSNKSVTSLKNKTLSKLSSLKIQYCCIAGEALFINSFGILNVVASYSGWSIFLPNLSRMLISFRNSGRPFWGFSNKSDLFSFKKSSFFSLPSFTFTFIFFFFYLLLFFYLKFQMKFKFLLLYLNSLD